MSTHCDRCGHRLKSEGISNDATARLVKEGKLIAMGAEREIFIARAEGARRPEPGDIGPGRFVVTKVDPSPNMSGWTVKVKPLVPPRSVGQRRPQR